MPIGKRLETMFPDKAMVADIWSHGAQTAATRFYTSSPYVHAKGTDDGPNGLKMQPPAERARLAATGHK